MNPVKPASVGWAVISFSLALLPSCEGGSGNKTRADAHVALDVGGSTVDVGVNDLGVSDVGTPLEDAGRPPADSTPAPDVSVPTPVEWGECPEFFSTECAHVELPLDWSEPDGQKISVLVARRPAADPNAPQLWLLQGGPGGSGGIFHTVIETVAERTGMSIYTLDHRGVGHSARLGCDDNGWVPAAEMAGCLATVEEEWGEGLAHFTTTAAARDLGALIDRTRAPGQAAFVYGVSYGADWAMRYLQLYPTQPAGVVLDSIPTPGVQFFTNYDGDYDPVARELMDLCAADELCRSKLGDQPWQFLDQLYTKVDAGHCRRLLGPENPRRTLRNLLGALLEDWHGRIYALAVIYRLDRCYVPDVRALTHLYETFFVPDAERQRLLALTSAILFWHIAFAEMWEQPAPSTAELEARVAPLFFSKDLALANPNHDVWPIYPPDEYVWAFPETQVPVLMLQGTLDPQTPRDLAVVTSEHFTAPHQTWTLVPGSPHGVALQSPVMTAGADTCGMQIIWSFLADPMGTPDTRCLADLAPVSFSFPAETNQHYLGTDDLWENP
jgi:pimeloyl-ACP methyl ester carboxylesterase